MVILKDEHGNDVPVDFDMMSTPEETPQPSKNWCRKCGRAIPVGESECGRPPEHY